MACGLPVIVSSQAGVSEVITDRVDGLVLKDPRDAASLAKLISELQHDPSLRRALGETRPEQPANTHGTGTLRNWH